MIGNMGCVKCFIENKMSKKIKFETAILAREKGFKNNCNWRFDEQTTPPILINWKELRVQEFFNYLEHSPGNEYHYSKNLKENYNDTFFNDDKGFYVSAPSQTTLNKWLSDNHNSYVEIYSNHSGWGWIITKNNGTTIKEIEDYRFFKTLEEALEKGLVLALNLIRK